MTFLTNRIIKMAFWSFWPALCCFLTFGHAVCTMLCTYPEEATVKIWLHFVQEFTIYVQNTCIQVKKNFLIIEKNKQMRQWDKGNMLSTETCNISVVFCAVWAIFVNAIFSHMDLSIFSHLLVILWKWQNDKYWPSLG